MNLANDLPVTAKEASEANSIRAGALDAERHQPSLQADMGEAEREQLLVSCDRRGDEQFGEPAAESVEKDSDVLVLVSVDADDDIVVP